MTKENLLSNEQNHLGSMELTNSSIDFIFIDPPFGSNLNYSELNWNDEAWQKIKTNNIPEAIENDVQKKGPFVRYRQLMTTCFKEAYRGIKTRTMDDS